MLAFYKQDTLLGIKELLGTERALDKRAALNGPLPARLKAGPVHNTAGTKSHCDTTISFSIEFQWL